MKPKLAFLLFKYFPHGGLQSDFLRIALECQRRGFEIVVYTRSWEGDIPAGFDVRLVPAKSWSNHGKARKYVAWVKRELEQHPVSGAVGFNRMPGLDVYFAADNCYAEKAVKQRGPLYRKGSRYRTYAYLEKCVFSESSATEVLLISERQKRGYINFYGTREERLHLLSPGMDSTRCRPADADVIRKKVREQLGVASDEHMLIQVGSGFITKGVDRSVRAVAALPDPLRKKARLYIAGNDRPARFERLAKRLGVDGQVTFLGGRDDVPSLLVAADLMVHPAVNEAAGIVLLEALASGLPVLCTAACGHSPHIASSGGGVVLAEPFEQRKLNDALANLLVDGELSVLGQKGLEYAGSTDLYSQHERAADIIEETIRKKN
jgi:UDP-glucose:(heptosyl)LPS alpha-1,3-glucosyltransferase